MTFSDLDTSIFQQPGIVGVTGHRLNRLPDPLPGTLLDMCRHLFGTPHPDCALLSCLADGTDLIAAAAWPETHVLKSLLPVDVETWRQIVSSSTTLDQLDDALARSTPEVLPNEGQPDYGALADALIDRCDRLFAVWDGAAGKPGGTGSVVARARALGKPVFHLPLARVQQAGAT